MKDRYTPTVYGIGYLGEGNFKTTLDGKSTKHYQAWYSMFNRCYDPKKHKRHPTYIGCSVHSEWHNFQVFAEWYDNQIQGKEGELHLDKDIISKGNKVYSPRLCKVVSAYENKLEAMKSRMYVSKVRDPDGKIWEIFNKKEFCLSHGLTQSLFNRMITGKRTHHKGWTVVQ